MKSHGDGAAKAPFRKRAEAAETEAGERIAKRLARAGIASRRDAEELIAAGRVSVNGRKLDSPAFNVTADDRIEVDGTAIPAIERTRLFLFHKPAGVVTTNRDPEGRKTVFDVLPADLPRLMTIGRLDINTEGLLLLTNDGGLSRVLELPATGWLRRYRVRVHGKVDEKALAALKDGIAVDGVFYGAVEASLDREQGTNAWLSIGLREGKNREVKNILGALGLDVSRLIRISYGPFQLADLPEGHVLEIKGRMLRDQLGERLIEEAGANFEAPVVSQFPNQPVKRAPEAKPEPTERPRVTRDGERGRIGEGGLIKKRHRREGARDEALGKLSTRPERSDRGPPRRGDRPDTFAQGADRKPMRGGKPERPMDPPGQRKANVWMAPGARPIGAGRAAAEKAEVEAKRAARKAHGKPGGKPGKPQGDRQERPRGDRPSGGRGGPRGRDADRRR
ncbi:pseudouridine synthase [Mesorhizobium sp. ZMM04-4]